MSPGFRFGRRPAVNGTFVNGRKWVSSTVSIVVGILRKTASPNESSWYCWWYLSYVILLHRSAWQWTASSIIRELDYKYALSFLDTHPKGWSAEPVPHEVRLTCVLELGHCSTWLPGHQKIKISTVFQQFLCFRLVASKPLLSNIPDTDPYMPCDHNILQYVH